MSPLKSTLIGAAFGLAAGALLTWAMVSIGPVAAVASYKVSPLFAGLFTTTIITAIGGVFGFLFGSHNQPS